MAALTARDSHHARAVVEQALEAGADPRAVVLEVLSPALHALGELWDHGQLSVADEHYATGVTEGVLALTAARMRRPPAGGRLAIVASPPGEHHGIPARIIGDFLEAEGWEVIVAGADVPARDLIELVGDEQPDLVCLSTTMPHNIEATFELLGALSTLEPRPLLACGGQAWDGGSRIADAIGADLVTADLDELVRTVRDRLPPLPDEDG